MVKSIGAFLTFLAVTSHELFLKLAKYYAHVITKAEYSVNVSIVVILVAKAQFSTTSSSEELSQV